MSGRPAAAVRYACAGALLLAFALLLPADGESSAGPPPPALMHPAVFFDEHQFASALTRAQAVAPQPMAGARALIIPHHWLAGHLILGGLRDLAAGGSYRRIILIGPNHVNAGSALVLTSDRAWQTAFGTVRPDTEAISGLLTQGVVRNEPEVLTYEHSVAGMVPAIGYFFPGAQVVPLILRHNVDAAGVSTLARALLPLLDGQTAIVAAVDFSHYLPAAEASQRNKETLTALRAVDADRLLSYGNEHLDSPPTIALVAEDMRLLGATTFEETADTNSQEVAGGPGTSVTSYITGFYR